MQSDRIDEMRLAEHVANGDQDAIRDFYDQYADLLYAFIASHVEGAPQDAEDVWQETLMSALRSIQRYRGESRLFTWLCSIARHKIADYYRRRYRSPIATAGELPEELTAQMDTASMSDDLIAQSAVRGTVVEALGSLSEEHRRALIARYAEEKDVTEVARLMGRTYKATESLLSRARAAFKTAIQHIEEKSDGTE